MSEKANDKPKPGAEFGVALRRLFDNPPYAAKALEGRSRWNAKTFAAAVGRSEKIVWRWLNGETLATQSIDDIIRILFSHDGDTKFKHEISDLRAILARCEYRKREKHPLPESRADISSARRHSDPAGDFINLNFSDIDDLPVEEKWRFDTVQYGEGVQVTSVPGSCLYWLDPSERMADTHGVRRPLTDYMIKDQLDWDNLQAEYELFFPRRIVIFGPKRQNATVRIFACTDIPYEQGLDDAPLPQFQAEAILGLGGISAFVDKFGSLRKRTDVEMGNGLGCVVVLVAIAYVHRRPAYRSPYCLVIRRGLRYPDDVWISPATGLPVFSSAEPSQGRFLFQSRESKGGSTDMFAANFNGTALVNLNATDETAYDGFVDEDGNNLTSWVGNRITFGSTVTGKGFIEKITREDQS